MPMPEVLTLVVENMEGEPVDADELCAVINAIGPYRVKQWGEGNHFLPLTVIKSISRNLELASDLLKVCTETGNAV